MIFLGVTIIIAIMLLTKQKTKKLQKGKTSYEQ